jgi:hypothetical protein
MRSRMTFQFVMCVVAPLLAGAPVRAQTPPASFPPERAAGAIESPAHTGGWILGGSGSFSVIPTPSNELGLSLSPNALVFVMPRLAVGADAVLALTHNDSGHSNTLGVGPTARFFIDDLSNRVLTFLSASVVPEWQDVWQNGRAFNERALTLDGSFGATFLMASHVGLTGEAFVAHTETRTTDSGLPSSVGGTSQYGVRFGFTVFVH